MGADDQDGGDRAGDSDREDRRTDRRSPDQLKVFVGGLPHEYDDRDLRDAFRKFEPSSAQVMRDKATNRSRHFGFVHFTDRRLMEEAIKELDGSMLEGKAISVKRAVPQEHIPPGTPASELERGRRRDRWPPRDYRYDRYDRAPHYDYPPAGAPYERMSYADRGAYPPSRSYDPYFDRGYDRGPQYYPGMRGFEDPYMRDPYGRDLYGRPMPGMEPPDRFRDPYRDAGYGRDMFDRGAMGSAYDRAAFPMPGDRGFDRDDRYDRYSPDGRAGGPDRGFDPRSPRYAARGPAIYDRAAAPEAGLRPGSPPRVADMPRR